MWQGEKDEERNAPNIPSSGRGDSQAICPDRDHPGPHMYTLKLGGWGSTWRP